MLPRNHNNSKQSTKILNKKVKDKIPEKKFQINQIYLLGNLLMIKSANILATYKNKVLVQKRDFSKNIKYKGYYCLFGGHLHKNESFIKAAKEIF